MLIKTIDSRSRGGLRLRGHTPTPESKYPPPSYNRQRTAHDNSMGGDVTAASDLLRERSNTSMNDLHNSSRRVGKRRSLYRFDM